MEALNALNVQSNKDVSLEGYYILTNILEPIIPHACWEISDRLFGRTNFSQTIEIKNEVFELDSVTLAVTINGKKRGDIEMKPNLSNTEVLELVKNSELAKKWIDGKEIIKEIVVPNKLVNIVIKG
jgi:leucyl-tRNA synthetase